MDFKKKLAVVLSAATVLMSAVPALSVSGAAAGYIKGDIDGDGKVGTADIVAVSNYITGKGELTEDQLIIADMNDDGIVNVFDQMLIRRTVLEIRDVVEVPEVTDPTEPTTEETEPTTQAPTEAPTEAETTLATVTEPVTDVTEEVTTEATEVVTTIVTEEVTTVATDVTEDVTTEATEVVTTIVTEEVTTVATDVTEEVTTEGTTVVTTAGTEVVTTIVTEEVTTVATDVTEEVTTVVTTAETEVVTTIETEPVTTVVTTNEAAVTYALPYEANIDPANTGNVDGIKFAVSADEGVTYKLGVQFFTADGFEEDSVTDSDAVDGVFTVNVPETIENASAITMVKVYVQWQSNEEASVVLTDVKVIIDGEETDPYVEPAKTVESAAAMMGVLGSNEFWSVDKLPEGSVVPTVTENGTYTAKLVLNEGTNTVEFLIVALDGLRGEDFADLKITVDSIKVDGEVLATADLSKAFINTGYKEGSFNGTRIYLTDTFTNTGAAAVPADTEISSSIEVTFTVSGIND
ncbi:MAG: dockerin type I repeat-containing protein [Porcipelethomonas sp.]